MHLLIDGTGIKIKGEGEWHARKHGGRKRRAWRKIHLGADAETLEIRVVEITGGHISDALVLPDLLAKIPTDQEIGSVTADGAYATRKCHNAIMPSLTTADTKIPRLRPVAMMEHIPPPKPHRNESALCQTARSTSHGAGLRSRSRRAPGPHRRAQPLYRAWHTPYGSRGISLSEEMVTSANTRFVQQSRLEV